MKKLLLTTGIFLSFGLLASAQEKKSTTAATTATPPAAVAKQRNNQEMLLPKDNTEAKNQELQNRENGVKPAAKRPATTAKKPAEKKAAPAATNDVTPVVN